MRVDLRGVVPGLSTEGLTLQSPTNEHPRSLQHERSVERDAQKRDQTQSSGLPPLQLHSPVGLIVVENPGSSHNVRGLALAEDSVLVFRYIGVNEKMVTEGLFTSEEGSHFSSACWLPPLPRRDQQQHPPAIATGDENGCLELWRPNPSWRWAARVASYEMGDEISALLTVPFPRHPKVLAMVFSSPKCHVLNPTTGEPERIISFQKDSPMMGMGWIPVTDEVIAVHGDCCIRCIRLGLGEEEKPYTLVQSLPSDGTDAHRLTGAVCFTCITSRSTTIVTGSSDHLVRSWDSRTGALWRTFRGLNHPIRAVDSCEDYVVAISTEGDIVGWTWEAEIAFQWPNPNKVTRFFGLSRMALIVNDGDTLLLKTFEELCTSQTQTETLAETEEKLRVEQRLKSLGHSKGGWQQEVSESVGNAQELEGRIEELRQKMKGSKVSTVLCEPDWDRIPKNSQVSQPTATQQRVHDTSAESRGLPPTASAPPTEVSPEEDVGGFCAPVKKECAADASTVQVPEDKSLTDSPRRGLEPTPEPNSKPNYATDFLDSLIFGGEKPLLETPGRPDIVAENKDKRQCVGNGDVTVQMEKEHEAGAVEGENSPHTTSNSWDVSDVISGLLDGQMPESRSVQDRIGVEDEYCARKSPSGDESVRQTMGLVFGDTIDTADLAMSAIACKALPDARLIPEAPTVENEHFDAILIHELNNADDILHGDSTSETDDSDIYRTDTSFSAFPQPRRRLGGHENIALSESTITLSPQRAAKKLLATRT